MICPSCGSNQVISQAVTETTTAEKVKGKSRTTYTTRTVHVCQTCGRRF